MMARRGGGARVGSRTRRQRASQRAKQWQALLAGCRAAICWATKFQKKRPQEEELRRRRAKKKGDGGGGGG
ncbi:unnamed protein product [Sphagnum jensenii]